MAQAGSILSTLILLPLLVQSFGVALYGTLALSASVTGYALLLDFGISATLVRLVAERTARKDSEGVGRAVLSAAMLYGMIGVTVAVFLAILGVLAGSIFDVSPGEALLLQRLLWVGAIASLWQWPAMTARDALAGLQRYDLIASVTLATVAADIAGTIYVLASGSGLVTYAVLRVAAQLLGSIVNTVLAVRLLPREVRRATPTLEDARHIGRSGSSIFALQIAGVMSRQQADKLIIGVFVGTAAVALYDLAAKLNSLVSTLMGLTVSAVLPVAAEIHAKGDRGAMTALFYRGTKLIASFMAPITTTLIVVAIPFMTTWLGPGFEQAGVLAQLLLASQLLLPLYQLGDQILIGKNRFSIWVRGGLTLACFNVALSVILVQEYGAVGVTAATLIACLLEFPWYLRVFSREMDIPVRDWLRRTAWPTYPLLVIPVLLGVGAIALGLTDTLPGLAATLAVAALAYWAVLLSVGYSAEERLYVFRLIPFLRPKDA